MDALPATQLLLDTATHAQQPPVFQGHQQEPCSVHPGPGRAGMTQARLRELNAKHKEESAYIFNFYFF